MSVFNRLATHLVAEVPVTTLQAILERPDDEALPASGILCGGGCRPDPGPAHGLLCGFSCRPTVIAGAPGIVDPDGALGVTAEDLENVRKSLPRLRRAVVDQIEANLAALR